MFYSEFLIEESCSLKLEIFSFYSPLGILYWLCVGNIIFKTRSQTSPVVQWLSTVLLEPGSHLAVGIYVPVA